MTPRRAIVAIALMGALAATLTPPPASAATACGPTTSSTADEVWSVASTRLTALIPGTGFPFGRTGNSAYVRSGARAWTSGFFPASLWLLYRQTQDPSILAAARRLTTALAPVSRWTGTHDLGFIVGLPMSLAMELDPAPDRHPRYEAALITAARSLSSRWNARIGALKSADYSGRWGLIIDSAMNAPLLIDVGQRIGGPDGERLARRGLQHMVTLAGNLLRPNGSTVHRMAFNPRTGDPLGPLPGQGAGIDSTWSRGQAWAINGFTRAYALTGDGRMLATARATADYWMDSVARGCIPAWDLSITTDSAPRDTSAAAIAVDGLLRLAEVEPDAGRAARYRAYAETTLASLLDPRWVSRRAVATGLLAHQAYNVPADAREGTYVWGDTYLLCALSTSGRQYTSIC